MTATSAAGTLVLTNEGSKAIEEIKAGDLVYSTNPETGESEYKEVARVFRRESDIIIHVFVNGEEIETTPNHPFWVENQWVLAKDLREGDVLTLADGTTTVITKTYGEQPDEPVIVYNFEVQDFHTYYVTNTGVLVHNYTCGINDNYGKDYEDLEDYRNSLGLPVAGSVDDIYTTAKLKIGNSEYYGVNGHGKHNEVKNTFNVNAQTATHAEADVFYPLSTT